MPLPEQTVSIIKSKLDDSFWNFRKSPKDQFGQVVGPLKFKKPMRYADQSVAYSNPIVAVVVHDAKPQADGRRHEYWLQINPAHYHGDAGIIPQAAVASTWRTGSGELAFKDWREYQLTQEV